MRNGILFEVNPSENKYFFFLYEVVLLSFFFHDFFSPSWPVCCESSLHFLSSKVRLNSTHIFIISIMTSKLYQPLKLGAITIANRVVMAPLTRCRSDNATHMPNDIMAEYYAQRATVGLIISECTMVVPNSSVFYSEPGIYEDGQIEGWKKITDSVHRAGGKMFMQIWHGGRVCPAEYNGGQQPVAPSPIRVNHHYISAVQNKPVPLDMPRALSDEEAQLIVKAFAEAATRAISAGLDGIEIHGANGYLVNQFLVPQANQRGPESRYCGASIETRARFLFDIVEACGKAIGSDRVGVRLSPYVTTGDGSWENPETDVAFVAGELNRQQIAYIHVERRDLARNPKRDLTVDGTLLFRRHFHGTIISNIDFERAEAEQFVDEGKADAIAFGQLLIANPELVRRFKEQRVERNPADPTTYYFAGAKGYLDYPSLQ